jgi:diguanylate cyclase (GGDEF)-like protein
LPALFDDRPPFAPQVLPVAANPESSIVALTIQCVGIVLIATLTFLLSNSIKRRFLGYWAAGWACLAVALAVLLMSFRLPVPATVCYALYCLGEYAFGYLLIAGCRDYATGFALSRKHWWMLVPGALVASLLAGLSVDFNALLIPHTLIMASFCLAAYRFLRPACQRERRAIGLRVVSVALLLLTVDFMQYSLSCSYSATYGNNMPLHYLQYSSLYDLILETLLAFGSVVAVMESVRRELEEANRELTAASGRLRALAEKDPLTEALNRHAFHSMLNTRQDCSAPFVRGCVGVVDVDDFKVINDTLGHAVGDCAIRAVARAIRSVIRAEDLLFRWGGDEFLIVLVGLAEIDARLRMESLNRTLAQTFLSCPADPVALMVSYGVAHFSDPAHLHAAIDRADREMYQNKQTRKVPDTKLEIDLDLLADFVAGPPVA